MINENSFELSDDQLAEVTGGNSPLISNVGNPQIAISNNFQFNLGIAPTIGVAVGGNLNLAGADLHLGNLISSKLKNKA